MPKSAPVLGLLGLILIGGPACTAHFHDSAKDALATQAQKAFTDAHLSDSIGPERDAESQMLKRETEAVRRLWLAQRDQILMDLLVEPNHPAASRSPGPPWRGKLDQRIQEGVKPLSGADLANKDIHKTLQRLPVLLDNLHRHEHELAEAQQQIPGAPPCSQSYDSVEAAQKTLCGHLPPLQALGCSYYAEACVTTQTMRKERDREIQRLAGPGSRLANINQRLAALDQQARKDQQELARRVKAASDAQQQYAVATKVKTDKVTLKSLLDNGTAAVAKLDAAVDGAATPGAAAPGAQLLGGALYKIQIQLDAVNAVLGDPTNPPATEPDIPALGASMCALRTLDGLRARLDAGAPLMMSSLLLTKQHLLIQQAQVQGQIEHARRNQDLLHAQLDASLAELLLLAHSDGQLRKWDRLGCGKGSGTSDKLPYQMRQHPRGECREALAEALTALLNSINLGVIPQQELSYALLSLQHQAVLEASEIALRHWENIVSVPLAQLAAYHHGGISAEDVARWLSVIEIAVTAVGVYY